MTRRRFIEVTGASLAGCCLASGCRPGAPLAEVSAEALSLHRESLVLDLHIDSLLWTRLTGYDLAAGHQNRLPFQPFGYHMDLPRALEGGLDGAVMGLVINPREIRDELMLPLKLLARWEGERGIAQVSASLDLLRQSAERHPDRLLFARSGSEAKRGIAEGRFVALAGIEGGHAIEGDLSKLITAYEQGARMLGLVHFQTSAAGHPMTVPAFEGRGLTRFGFELIAELERLGMVVDLAHLNSAGVADALGKLKRPFVVSHSGCQAICPHARNLTDEQLRAIADAGGIVGIAFGRSFVGGAGGVADLLDHVEHALEVAGSDSIALGSDYDGFIVPVGQMGDVRSYPLITQGLLERGVPVPVIQKILGENALRVLTEVCG